MGHSFSTSSSYSRRFESRILRSSLLGHHHSVPLQKFQTFELCQLDNLLAIPSTRKLVISKICHQPEELLLVRFIDAVNEYEALFESGSQGESLVETEKFVSKIVDLYLLNKKDGKYRTGKLRQDIIDVILEGEFEYLFLAKEDALCALMQNSEIQRLVQIHTRKFTTSLTKHLLGDAKRKQAV